MDPLALIDVYVAENEQQAHIIRAWLADAGVECTVSGGALQGAVGDIPVGIPTAPRIVAKAASADRAKELIREWEQSSTRAGANPPAEWQCLDCGEMNAASFELCWNCYTAGGGG
jgi:hypothetical protein